MTDTIVIDGKTVGGDLPPYVIAELSGNHNQDIDTARAMIRAAAEAGVDAVKLQTYTADTLTLDSDRPEFRIEAEDSLWQGETLYELYQRAHTPWEWHAELFELARECGISIFSSPFDESSVEFLEGLNAPCYKIASFELTHLPLLRAVAQTGKPVILSTGMATLDEIEEAVATLRQHGCSEYALLKCTSAYPAPVADANLATIADMKARFGVPVGLSDHSHGIGVALAAAALGADVIERHFVLDRDAGGVDAPFSSGPDEFHRLVCDGRNLRQVIGRVHYGSSGSEQDSLRYRRSIYVSAPVRAGDVLGSENLRIVRPGLGLRPEYWDDVIGQHASRDLEPGMALSWADIDAQTRSTAENS